MNSTRFLLIVVVLVGGALASAAQTDAAQDALSMHELYNKGDSALASGDYIASLYYFRRMIDSEAWDSYEQKADVMYKIGLLEESQSNSDAAAQAFGRLINYLESHPDDPSTRMYYFYAIKYCDALERAGLYERASEELWKVLDQTPQNQHSSILQRLIENYRFQDPVQSELERLHQRVIPDYQQTLGWNLASLYFSLGNMEQSIALYDMLWPQNLMLARNYAEEMARAYQQANLFDDLMQKLDDLRAGNNPSLALMLQTELLTHANQGEDALELIETHLQEKDILQGEMDAAFLVDALPNQLLDSWVSLLEKFNQQEKAIKLLRASVKQSPMDIQKRERLSALLETNDKTNEAVELWLSWANEYSNNPTTILNAAEKLQSLGASDAATDLLDSLQQNIPANLAYKQAQILLNLGRFDRAFDTFTDAVNTQQIRDEMVIETINDYSLRHSIKPLVSHLITRASGTQFSQLPAWARRSVMELGIENDYQEELEQIAKNEANGVWYYHLAQEAIRQNQIQWAESLLKKINENDIYHSAAQRQLASIYSRQDTIPMQQKAADLWEPSLAPVLNASADIQLNRSFADRLLEYSEMRLNAYQPGKALTAIQKIESASDQFSNAITPVFLDRVRFNRARSLVELSSFDKALSLLEEINQQPYLTEARYLKGRVHLAQHDYEEARVTLLEVVNQPGFWKRENDALSLLKAMEPLVGESLELFGTVQQYELQGRLESAEPLLRQLAVNHYNTDTEEWARYTIGKLYHTAGKTEEAKNEWERLAVDADHPVIHGLIRYELMQQKKQAGAEVEESTAVQSLLIDFPNTLFSDMARLAN